MLSFGYSLLLNEVITALYLTGFDPYIGFLHSVEYSKPALALDLIEEFRQPIVDRLVKKLINMDMIEQENFEILSEKVLFNEEGRNIFLKSYEDKILSEISYNETNLSWRKVIRKQSQLLKKSIENDSEYKAIEVR
jgi:CRISPR-associated protein Cas1